MSLRLRFQRWRQNRVTVRRERAHEEALRYQIAEACPEGGFHHWKETAGFDGTWAVWEWEYCTKCGLESGLR